MLIETMIDHKLRADEQFGLLFLFTGSTGLVIGILSVEIYGLVYGMLWAGAGLMSMGFGAFMLFKHNVLMMVFGAGLAIIFIAASLHVSGVA